MNSVVEILINRDGITQREAEELVNMTREEILESGSEDAEDILLDNLGLEGDYLFDVLDGIGGLFI